MEEDEAEAPFPFPVQVVADEAVDHMVEQASHLVGLDVEGVVVYQDAGESRLVFNSGTKA